MRKSKAETATNWVALLGFLTAFCGMAQTMWTTSPWWRKDKSATAASKIVSEDDLTAEKMSEEVAVAPIGAYVMVCGMGILAAGMTARFALRRKRLIEEDVAKRMAA